MADHAQLYQLATGLAVALVDVGITEWRGWAGGLSALKKIVALVDVGITEWRNFTK